MLGFLIQLSCVIGMIIYIILMPKRTPYGQAILGKIVGYRTFLEVAEKDRLEAMVAKYPTYFFDILPYTYALGISFEWVMKFRNITMSKPVWLDSPHDFDLSNFNSFIDGITASFQPPSSSLTGNSGSSSSGSSGGGLSGGKGRALPRRARHCGAHRHLLRGRAKGHRGAFAGRAFAVFVRI